MIPPALFSELVRTAESLLHKRAEELVRRQEWLATPVEDLGNRNVEVVPGQADKYRVNLDEFKLKTGRLPHKWKEAVRIASWIHIDEMRTLLEMHYDTVHFEKWTRKDGKAPLRKGDHTVPNEAAQA